MLKNNQKTPKPKTNAVKQWKAARSKPSATTAKARSSPKNSNKPVRFSETPEARKARAARIIDLLEDNYADAHCSLTHSNSFELLISTILSAQCTDARVNMVTPGLFKKYPTPQAFALARVEDIEKEVKSTGFYRNKAKNIKACSELLVAKYGGQVPQTLEELIALPGVGRKTANVILGNAFGTPGIVVDTHVGRLSYRLGLTVSPQAKAKNPEVIERELEQIIEKKHWIDLAHLLIYHGRAICDARKPKCNQCFLAKMCPRLGVGEVAP
jgi:endonuclease III